MLIRELLAIPIYPLSLGFLGGVIVGFLLRKLGRVVAAIIAIGVFILNILPLLTLMGLQPNIEWIKRLEEFLPTPLRALEGFKVYLPLLLNIPFFIGLITGLIIGFKVA